MLFVVAREPREEDWTLLLAVPERPAPPALALSLKRWEARGVQELLLGCVWPSVLASWWELSAYWTRNSWCSCPGWGSRAGTEALQGLKPQQEGRHHSLFGLAQLSLPPQRSCRASQPRTGKGVGVGRRGAALISLLN